MAIGNVLANRYASEPMREVWTAESKIIAERRLWLAVLARAAGSRRGLRRRRPDAVIERVRGGGRRGRPGQHRRSGEDHPARREGADRGVQRPGRLRARAQGDDLARPHRERRAAADRLVAQDHPGPDRSPPWSSWPGWPTEYADQPIAGRSHNVAAQITTLGKRFATAAEELLVAYERVDELIARYPLRGIKGPVGTSQDMLDLVGGDAGKLAGLEQRIADHLGFARVLRRAPARSIRARSTTTWSPRWPRSRRRRPTSRPASG